MLFKLSATAKLAAVHKTSQSHPRSCRNFTMQFTLWDN